MRIEFSPITLPVSESSSTLPWERTITGSSFSTILHRLALSRNIRSQTELAKRVGVTQPTVANWISGKNIPKAVPYDHIIDALNPNEKAREQLNTAYRKELRDRRVHLIQAERKRGIKPETPVGKWFYEYRTQKKISSAELEKCLLGRTLRSLDGISRWDNLSLSTLSEILLNAPEKLDLKSQQVDSLSEAVAKTVEKQLAKGRRFQDGIKGQAIIELQKRIPFKTFNGQQAGKILGRTRESVRQLREKLGLPLLLNPYQLELLRTFPKRKRGKDRASREITTRSSHAA